MIKFLSKEVELILKEETSSLVQIEHHELNIFMPRRFDNEYQLINSDSFSKEEFKVFHTICNHLFDCSSLDLYSNDILCPVCRRKEKLVKETQRIQHFLDEHYPNEYTMNTPYLGNDYPLTLKHNDCQNEIKVYAYQLLEKNDPCLKCSRKKKQQRRIAHRISEITNNEYSLAPDFVYQSFLEKMSVLHHSCNRISHPRPNDFFNKGSRCPYCSPHIISERNYRERLRTKHHEDYEIVSSYISENKDITIKHKDCNRLTTKKASSILNSRVPCDFCGNRFENREQLNEKIQHLVGEEYAVIGDYNGMATATRIKHNKCGFEYEITPHLFIKRNQRCPKCSGRYKTVDEVKKKIQQEYGCHYQLVGDFHNTRKPMTLMHIDCGCPFQTTYFKFFSSKVKCPHCSLKKKPAGEKRLNEILRTRSKHDQFAVVRNFSMEYCTYIVPLIYDFALFQNNQLIGLIEFDDEKHFFPIEEMGGIETLKEIKIRDRVKEEYCSNKKVPLLRIHFEDKDVKEKIDHFLNPLLIK